MEVTVEENRELPYNYCSANDANVEKIDEKYKRCRCLY